MSKIAFFVFLLILFIFGIAIANNRSMEQPLDPYLKSISDLFTRPVRDDNDLDFNR